MAKRKKANFTRVILIGLALAVLLSAAAFFVSRVLEKRTYALLYAEEIKKHADDYALSRYLVAAVIHCESGNDKDARSYRGALGLMQIMPETGAWIAEKLGVENFTEDMLLEPEWNIRFGCWYLSFLAKRYDDLTKVLAAYNAGPGNVEKWLNDPAYASEGKLVSIPFEETSNYVEKVSQAIKKYEELYERELSDNEP
ncbi:MAG TPA: lytic transglycosylase domain-containing protein [Clostridia bacterium]|jgi:soluble lytic murein transglycosylase|nr:lytic transglycosylase domain-containing protein [Clostridia bacterium]